MKRRGSSETRFPKVWCRSELCSRGERPFEVSKIFCPGTKPGRYETRPVRDPAFQEIAFQRGGPRYWGGVGRVIRGRAALIGGGPIIKKYGI